VEFQTPAGLIAFIFAFQHLATPSGLIAGYLSDRMDPRQRRRTPFIVGGMLLSLAVMPFFPHWGLALAAAPQKPELLWLGVCLFTLFGVGTTVSATAINALLVDQLPKTQRGTGMTLVWILTLTGFVTGSAFFHTLFPGNQLNQLEIIFWIFTGLALAITLISVTGIEVPKSVPSPPAKALAGMSRILLGFSHSGQAILFFSFLAAAVFFPAMQSFILTPYGGELLKLEMGDTAKFGIYTSYGTLLGMGAAYWWQEKGADRESKFWLSAALLIGAAAFGLLSASAWHQQRALGEAGLWVFGFSKGLFNVGISFLTMRLVHPAFSGVFMGLWNLISGLALAVGEITGGLLLDLGLRFWGTLGASYAVVFLVIGSGLLGCLALLGFINVTDYWRQIAGHFGLKIPLKPEVQPSLATPR
jgi:BCD family chlorophyll transporter-like MFS transporter